MPRDADLIADLAEHQVSRLRAIRAVNRLDNAAAALVRRTMGWRFDMPEAERGQVNKRAKAIVAALFEGKAPKAADAEIAAAVAPEIEVYRQAREPLVRHRHHVELDMKRLARSLPVWKAWAKGVRGFGELSLAAVVAEAGDLSGYDRKDKLFKRFGLAPHDGRAYSTWRRKGGLKAEDWEDAGYRPARNAECYAVLGDPLFRAQSGNVNEETGEIVREPGPYRVVYDRAKAAFLERGATKGHAHMHGLRLMRKAALQDLWRVWRGLPPLRSDKEHEPLPMAAE